MLRRSDNGLLFPSATSVSGVFRKTIKKIEWLGRVGSAVGHCTICRVQGLIENCSGQFRNIKAYSVVISNSKVMVLGFVQ